MVTEVKVMLEDSMHFNAHERMVILAKLVDHIYGVPSEHDSKQQKNGSVSTETDLTSLLLDALLCQ